ncbi:membrane-associated protein [Bifidobacterium reuteri DSM 23975]|uniref:Membrane-associated protein n=1 Tax=Bifidobacterium reuteri DSM 23975 TaxID=1437610 RepID=A0A087CYV9_9BIFI|nr:hypothetical protein [Bifidobacterium reuteri]KFI88459.1 membrane-associated protein [Bifidobacterium reuteri DSM 23975]
MGYESLSTVIVLVIAVIVVAVWLPARTANGMKRAAEHRQDRYSPSLRIVEAADGRRFGDVKPREAKGAAMPVSTTSGKLTPAHIAHVRELRRQSIRRRQILVGALLAVTVLVVVLGLTLHFSPLFALIPFSLTVVVLALGANAARQAREWERKVRRYERTHARTRTPQVTQNARRDQATAEVAGSRSESADRSDAGDSKAAVVVDKGVQRQMPDETSTEVMEQRQIRRALRAAEVEQAKAKAERERQRRENQSEAVAEGASQQSSPSADSIYAETPDQADAQSSRHTPAEEDTKRASATEPSLTVRDERDQEMSDATSELASVTPARALDVFDMATSQDLISFSLGEPRNEGNAPESLEIKSTRQVSKAEPVAPEVAERLIDEARAAKAADDAQAAEKAESSAKSKVGSDDEAGSDGTGANEASANVDAVQAEEAESFREREEHAEVEAPAATSDSLSVGLDSILARRGN